MFVRTSAALLSPHYGVCAEFLGKTTAKAPLAKGKSNVQHYSGQENLPAVNYMLYRPLQLASLDNYYFKLVVSIPGVNDSGLHHFRFYEISKSSIQPN
jgi:hypothetical protein